MPTTGKLKGSLVRLFVADSSDYSDEVEVGCMQTTTANFEAEEVEAPACRDDIGVGESGGWKVYSTGDKSYTIDVSGLIILDNPFNRDEFFSWLDSGQSKFFRLTTDVSGDTELQGSALCVSQSNSYPQQEFAGYDVTLRGTGEPSYVTIV